MNDWQRMVITLLGGGLGGAILTQVWTRLRNRLATVRWTSYVWDIAVASEDQRIGKLELFYNGERAYKIQGCRIEIENESNVDLTNVEVNLSYLNKSAVILTAEGGLINSTQLFPFSDAFQTALNRVRSLPPEDQLKDADTEYLRHRCDFRIPVLNRGRKAELRLVLAPMSSAPTLAASCDHTAVRFINRPPHDQWWGEPRNAAALIGALEAVGSALLLAQLTPSPIWLVLSAILGAFCLVPGAATLKAWRFLRQSF